MDASFFDGSPYPTRWKVSLCPRRRRSRSWEFTFYLQCVQPYGEDDSVEARRLGVTISFNKHVEKSEQKEIYIFELCNGHTFKLDARVPLHGISPLRVDALTIDVEMDLPSSNQEGNPLYCEYLDLHGLSTDFWNLHRSGNYSDLMLRPNDSDGFRLAHSYILLMRWCNFFKEHDFDFSGRIRIGISDFVLRDILSYVYSGRQFLWGNTPFGIEELNEVFEVIDRYKLHHLYASFFKSDSHQDRVTRKEVSLRSTIFPLDRDNCVPFEYYSNPPPWNINPGTHAEFVFRIKFFKDADRPKFSYKLESRARRRFHAQVNLSFLWRRQNMQTQTCIPVHQRDYITVPGGTKESGDCIYDSAHPAINNFFSSPRDGSRDNRVARHNIRCVLKFFDGSRSVTFEVYERIPFDVFYLKDRRDLYEILSSHMYPLSSEFDTCDLTVTCPTGDRESPFRDFLLHKGIFTARIPQWRSVIEENEDSDAIPNHVTCIYNCKAFEGIIDWIYTGKLFPIANRYLHDVEQFAVRGDLRSLRNLAHRMRSARQN